MKFWNGVILTLVVLGNMPENVFYPILPFCVIVAYSVGSNFPVFFRKG